MVFSGPAERMEEAVRALKNFARPTETFTGQQGSDDAAMSRPARMKSFCPGTVCQVFNNTRALAAAESERIAPLTQLETIQFARRSRSAESGTQCGGMKAARVKFSRRDKPDFAHYFGAGNRRF